MRFWLGKVGIVLYTREAFLQIAIDVDQREFLRMIWFKNLFAQHSTVKILRFEKVVFGLTSSPFFLNEIIRIHLQKYLRDKRSKKIIQKIIGDLYVEDVTLTLRLTIWVAKNEKIQQYFNSKESNDKPSTGNTNLKVLGLTWYY